MNIYSIPNYPGFVKLEMAPAEIVTRYENRAVEPAQMVKILAQLNGVERDVIAAVLAEAGISLPGARKKPNRQPRKWKMDLERVETLYRQGWRDLEISREMGVPRPIITGWRNRRGLPCNIRR